MFIFTCFQVRDIFLDIFTHMMYKIMHAKMHTHTCMKKQDRGRLGKIKREEVRQMVRECEREREFGRQTESSRSWWLYYYSHQSVTKKIKIKNNKWTMQVTASTLPPINTWKAVGKKKFTSKTHIIMFCITTNLVEKRLYTWCIADVILVGLSDNLSNGKQSLFVQYFCNSDNTLQL